MLAAVVVTPQLLGGWACSRLEGVEPAGAVLPPKQFCGSPPKKVICP